MAGGAAVKSSMTFEEAWPILQEEAIDKIINYLEGHDLNHQIFTSDQYMRLYTLVYDMCSPNNIKNPQDQKLYDEYKRTFEDYISSKVLPCLKGKEKEDLLQELLRRWNNHKILTRWLFRIFHYLSRYFIRKNKLPSLEETCLLTFHNMVYGEIKDQVIDAIVSLIDREREGEQIDQTVLKKVMDIYTEMDTDALRGYFAKDLEAAIIEATAKFYSGKALNWITNNSLENYNLMVEECLEEERKRVGNYLRLRSKDKILEVVEHELVIVRESKLVEKMHLHQASA